MPHDRTGDAQPDPFDFSTAPVLPAVLQVSKSALQYLDRQKYSALEHCCYSSHQFIHQSPLYLWSVLSSISRAFAVRNDCFKSEVKRVISCHQRTVFPDETSIHWLIKKGVPSGYRKCRCQFLLWRTTGPQLQLALLTGPSNYCYVEVIAVATL